MKRKKKANFSVPTVICVVIAVLTIIWIGDSVVRGFRKPSTEIVCIDDRETEAEMPHFPSLPWQRVLEQAAQ